MLFSLRIGCNDHKNPEVISKLIEDLSQCGKSFDEVWFATSYGLPSPEQCEENGKQMKAAAAEFAKAGITPSMQISRTMGHTDTALKMYGGDGVKDLPVNTVISINGEEGVARFCWNNPAFREYIVESMKRYIQFQPEIIWIDDDMRITNMGKSRYLCFCENCIRLFNEKHGYSYTRETLKPDFLKNRTIRDQYFQFHTQAIGEFCGMLSRGLHEVAPNARLALQNGGESGDRPPAHRACLEAMRSATGMDVGFRAGAGFYDDHNPIQMLDKAISVNYMNARLPDYVTLRASEIENLPYVAYGKSTEATCLEASVYMAYGCNMASVTLMRQPEDASFYQKMFRKIAQYRPYLEALVAQNEQTKNGGLVVYQSEKSHLAMVDTDSDQDWFTTSIFEAQKLLRCGIPLNVELTGSVYLLSQKSCDHLLPEDVEFLLHQPVVTDAASLLKLTALGFGDKILATVRKAPEEHQLAMVEKTTSHPANNGIVLSRWQDSYFSSRDPQYCIEGDSIESISDYYTNQTNERVGSAMAIVTTAYGAKWLVKGANLCLATISLQRRNQFLNAVNCIAAQPIPAYVNSTDQIVVIPRITQDGKTKTVTLLNVSISEAEDFEVIIENPTRTDTCTLYDPYRGEKTVPLVCKNGRYSVTVDQLPSWHVMSIFC